MHEYLFVQAPPSVRSRHRRELAVVCIITLISFLTIAAEAQERSAPITISDRIGQHLSLPVRNYFGLFTSIDGFRSASAFQSGDGALEFRIARTSGSDTSLTISEEALAQLRLYIEHFEGLFGNDPIVIDWEVLNGIVQPTNPFIGNPMRLAVIDRHGREIEGRVVFADDSLLVLAPDAALEAERLNTAELMIFIPSELKRVRDRRGFVGHWFSDLDIPLGRNDTIYRKVIRPEIGDRMLYYPHVPPEIMSLLEKKSRHEAPASLPPTTTDDFYEEIRRPRFDIGIAYGNVLVWDPSSYTATDYGRPGRIVEVGQPGSSPIAIEVGYLLSRRWRLGLFAMPANGAEPTASALDYERYTRATIDAHARYIVIPSGLLLTNMVRRFELALGAAVSVQPVTVESRIAAPASSGDSISHVEDHLLVGASIHINLGYYVSQALSIEAQARFAAYPNIEMESRTLESLDGQGLDLRTHSKYSISTTAGTIFTGLRFHF